MTLADLQQDEVVLLKGKPHPLFKGILRLAHANGLVRLEVTCMMYPTDSNGNLAVCEATATFVHPDGRDRVYTEVGDCSDTNCGPMIAPHKVRMAATRAKGRALRDALGIGEALAEELADLKEGPGNAPGSSVSASRPSAGHSAQTPPSAPVGTDFSGVKCSECQDPITNNELKACEKRDWPPLCYKCGHLRKKAETANA